MGLIPKWRKKTRMVERSWTKVSEGLPPTH